MQQNRGFIKRFLTPCSLQLDIAQDLCVIEIWFTVTFSAILSVLFISGTRIVNLSVEVGQFSCLVRKRPVFWPFSVNFGHFSNVLVSFVSTSRTSHDTVMV